MSVGQLKGMLTAAALETSVAAETELLEQDQKRSQGFPTPSRVSSELRRGLLRERNFVTSSSRGSPALSPAPGLWVAEQGAVHQGAVHLLAALRRRPLKTSPSIPVTQ